MTTKKIKGLILSSKNFFESDKLIDCFTENEGKLQCLIKSAQKISSNYGGKCDPLTVIEGVIYVGKSFNILSQISLVQSFENLRKNFNTLQTALFYLKVIKTSTEYTQKNKNLYTLLLYHLAQLNETKYDITTCKNQFYTDYLAAEGLLESKNTVITEDTFIRILSDYTNKIITSPLYIKAM